MKKDQEIHDLKSKIAEVMAVMPPGTYPGTSPPATGIISTPRYFCNVEDTPAVSSASVTGGASATGGGGGGATPTTGSDGGNSGGGSGGGASSASSGSPVPTPEPQQGQQQQVWDKSILDPNAACYRPKSN